jgi:hypothetical protein
MPKKSQVYVRPFLLTALLSTTFLCGFAAHKYKLIPFHLQARYAIGIYKGDSPYNLVPAPGIKNPVLQASDVTDVKTLFVADPFMVQDNGKWTMFFEVLEEKTNLGMIGAASSNDCLKWHYDRIVLREPYHLSFPYVFKENDQYYMVPESHAVYGVYLYKASAFPHSWVKVKRLVQGDYSDPAIVKYNGRWWLFSSDRLDMAHLFYADSLLGDWHEHPMSPIVFRDLTKSRLAGRITLYDGKMVRFVQNCTPAYGTAVRGFTIVELTPTTYREEPLQIDPVLKGSGKGWNGVRMHQIDPHKIGNHQWIACVDGVGKTVSFGSDVLNVSSFQEGEGAY